MKLQERERAVELRKNGLTYPELSKVLGVSKGSLNRWLKDIFHIATQERLDRRRLASVQNGRTLHDRKIVRVEAIKRAAKSEIRDIDHQTLRILGVVAYWCEGSKTEDSLVKFTNSDESLIKLMMKWFRMVCNVRDDKFRIYLRLHADVDRNEAEDYWSETTGIPRSQFYRTAIKESGSSGKRNNYLPYGVASITICDTELFYRIRGWIDGVKDFLGA